MFSDQVYLTVESLKVFKNPIVREICNKLIAMCGSSRTNDACLKMHVMHNNAFRIDPGGKGQASVWHTDDAPTFMTRDGKPLPESVNIAPLVLTCMYFLNDLRGPQDGGTRVIPGSHRFGKPCTTEEAEKHPRHYARGPEGSVLILSSNLWHRGASVKDNGMPRYVFQVSYGRRLVGHKHGTIMNYQLPEITMDAIQNKDDSELMGFLQGGAYS